ncbi:hypothetical protein PG987_010805 [Apiospora arundinis]
MWIRKRSYRSMSGLSGLGLGKVPLIATPVQVAKPFKYKNLGSPSAPVATPSDIGPSMRTPAQGLEGGIKPSGPGAGIRGKSKAAPPGGSEGGNRGT